MEVTLTDDQEFFRDTTHRFLSSECPLTTVRALADDPAGFDDAYWTQGAELGWTSMLVAEDDGGGSVSGDGAVDLTLIADAFGTWVSPGPLLPANVVAAAVSRRGTDAQKQALLPGLLDGSLVAAWCGDDAVLGSGSIRARTDGDQIVLDGSCSPVEAAGQSQHLLVTASAENGLVQVLVPVGADGLTVTPLHSLDLVRRFARVDLDSVRVPASAMLGAPDTAAADAERQLQFALVVQTAEMVGAAQRTFDFTLEWAFDRYSFGRPLASYQELKHRFADMKMWLEASHALAAALAREVASGDARARETASAAKAYLGHHLAALAQDCVQLHGGIGLTSEHDIHLYLRRITVGRSTYGTPSQHRHRLGVMAGEEAA